jgi:eukaryotic-like serine/threonine-protein kinase
VVAKLSPRVAPLGSADPRNLGVYRLLGRLGVGGMGVVYVAADRRGRQVAIKLIHGALAADDEFRRRFRREVSRARQVPPFCTAEVLDADVDHDPPYLVVEYIDGPNLSDAVAQSGPLTSANLHSLAIGVATALTAIHGAGVVHRDLKPSNVLLAPGSPKVIDFGIAQTDRPTTALTSPDQLAGTIAYMAPERFDNAPVTTASDIFSWGVVIAYAGTGRNPFGSGTASSIAGRILTQRPELSGLPSPLRNLVEAALAKNPAARPTARELLDLLLAAEPRPTTPKAARAAARPVRAWQRLGVPVAALLLGGLVTLAGLHAVRDGSVAQRAPAPAASLGWAPLINDPLSRSGQWIYTNLSAEHATCTITDRLRATRTSRGVLLCTGPEMHLRGDHSIDVDTALESSGSCAAIWFFWTGEHGGYVLRICGDAITLAADRSSDRRVLGSLPLTDHIALHRPLHVRIVARTERAEVFRDGTHVGDFPLPAADPKDGGDALGLSVESVTDPPPYAVTYANVDIRIRH